MPTPTPDQVRRVFLSRRAHVTLMTAADLLGMALKDLKRDIGDGVIVATSTPLGVRVAREEVIGAAMRLWEQTVIEDALGDEAAGAAGGDPARASKGARAALPARRAGSSRAAAGAVRG